MYKYNPRPKKGTNGKEEKRKKTDDTTTTAQSENGTWSKKKGEDGC
jgi:hypothetical protein